LTTEERLGLFAQVCEGVQHAHRKGIIHRDIKPSNVLVEQQDGEPVAKIIDFGVAKAIEQRLTERTVYTEQGVLIGTPEYMSPEQAGRAGADVDTRTDIYSLGVLLYELLAGVLPLDSRELRQAGFEEILRRIREEEPPRPSTRVSATDEVSAGAARRRRTNPRSLARELRGELDWITMKAIEKDRERRYGSPSELAADLRRHLEGRPVVAGPPGAVYVLRKFVRRHRLTVTLAVVAVLALAGFAVRERIQRERIGRERDRANRVSAFLTELFTVSDPKKARGREITVEEVLRRGSERIQTELAEEPEVQAALMHTMGRVYRSLGLYEEGEPLLRQAVAIRKRRLGREHPETLRSMAALAIVYRNQGRFAETDSLLRETLGARRRTLGEDHPDTLVSMRELSRLLWEQGRYEEGVALIEQTLEIQ
jgi:non-specific serine/threonine protein kinase/serine/threonine-protein kinase